MAEQLKHTPTPQTAERSEAQSNANSGQRPDTELRRVREIILGSDITSQRLQGAEVDRLRQVIFGPQMEEYERRFADVQREIERVGNDLRLVQDTVSDFEKRQTKRLDALEREMRRANDEMQREIERLKNREGIIQRLLTRAQQQEMTNQRTAEQTQEAQERSGQLERDLRMLRGTLTDYQEQQTRKLDGLRREIRQAEDNLRSELRRITDRLNDQKTDRKALSAMLMEVATRLETDNSMTGLLEDLNLSAPE